MHKHLNRRQFLARGSASVTTAAAIALFDSHLTFADDAPGDAVVPFLDPQPGSPKAAFVRWEDLTDWITPMKNFFGVSHYNRPSVDAGSYSLRVDGMVKRPMSLSIEQIKARPKKEVTATLECSGNGAAPTFMGAIGNARWAGASLADVLKECEVSQDAIEVAFWGADKGKEKLRGEDYEQNFARALSIDDARREDILFAYEMNGEPLQPGHGAPLRLIVPGWYGIAWVKWLTRVEVRSRRLMNRFMARDYVTIRGVQHGDNIEWQESSVGPMNVKSIVARVVRHADKSCTIWGAAWTDGTPVKSIEVKIDDGNWVEAKPDTAHHATYSWTFWSYDWKEPKPGEHVLVSRATDEKGRVQPTADDPEIKLKKTYWEAYAQVPRRIRI